jgi:hypothetical protein
MQSMVDKKEAKKGLQDSSGESFGISFYLWVD